MKKVELSNEVRRFVLASVPSVPYLEALLLMRGEPGRRWNTQRLARRLYTSEIAAGQLLNALCDAGIVRKEAADDVLPSFSYDPAPELALRLDAVAESYAKHLVEVTDLIHSRLDKKAKKIADAFRWRSED